MIAIATLAALGQAIHTAETGFVIGTLTLLAAVVLLVGAGLATRPGWKPKRMREAGRPPLLVRVDPGELARALAEDEDTDTYTVPEGLRGTGDGNGSSE